MNFVLINWVLGIAGAFFALIGLVVGFVFVNFNIFMDEIFWAYVSFLIAMIFFFIGSIGLFYISCSVSEGVVKMGVKSV